ncbi:MAG: SWIM zinc finger family protein [Thermoprotei archaeon]
MLTAIRFENSVFGEVVGTKNYVTHVNLDNLSSTCTCPVRLNCKHGVALLLQFLSGNYIDGNKIMHDLESAEKFELLKILKSLIKDNPMLLLNIQQIKMEPSAELMVSIERQIKKMLQTIKNNYADEDFANTFAKLIKTYGDFLDKELIFYVLEFLVKNCEKYGCFYNEYYDYYFGEEIFKNLCDVFTKKSLETSDFERLQKLVKEDEYSMLDPFLIRMVKPENAQKLEKFSDHVRKLLENEALYVEFLINAGKKEEAKRILKKNRNLNEDEYFNLYLKIDEKEALELAKEKKYYSSLIQYYYEMNAYEDVVTIFRNALMENVKLKPWPELYEGILTSIKICKPKDSKELLQNLLNICYSFKYYDLCIDIGFELKDLETLHTLLNKKTDNLKPNQKLKLLKHLSTLEPERTKEELKTFTEELINKKGDSAYENVVECILTLKKLMNKEEWIEYLKKLYKTHHRKDKLWNKIRNKGIKIEKEGNNLIISY